MRLVLSVALPPFLLCLEAEAVRMHLGTIEARIREEVLGDILLEEAAELARQSREIYVQLDHLVTHLDIPVILVSRCEVSQNIAHLDLTLHFADQAPVEYFQFLEELGDLHTRLT
jgi:hypothetical protein